MSEKLLFLFFFGENIVGKTLSNLFGDGRRTIVAAFEARLVKRKLLLAQRRRLGRRIVIMRPTPAFISCVCIIQAGVQGLSVIRQRGGRHDPSRSSMPR